MVKKQPQSLVNLVVWEEWEVDDIKKSFLSILFILVIGLLLLVIILYPKDKYSFEIYFFNAGKADAILVSLNEYYILIDTGEEELCDEILSYFKKKNITKLDYLIITHFDKDHVGSASKIIDEIEVNNVLQSNYPKDSSVYQKYLISLENRKLNPTIISSNYVINLDALEITVNGPEIIYDSNPSNNSSLIISMKYQNTSYLFMGDSQNQRINDFLENNSETYDFIKIPYHGNYQKTLDSLLDSVKAKYAVITCSNKEKEDEKVIDLLDKYKIKYYLTRNGNIRITSDGEKINLNYI